MTDEGEMTLGVRLQALGIEEFIAEIKQSITDLLPGEKTDSVPKDFAEESKEGDKKKEDEKKSGMLGALGKIGGKLAIITIIMKVFQKAFGDVLKLFMDLIGAFIKPIADLLLIIFAPVIRLIYTYLLIPFYQYVYPIIMDISKMWNDFIDNFSWAELQDSLEEGLNNLIEWLNGGVESIREWWAGIEQKWDDFKGAIGDYFAGLWNKFISWGSNLLTGIWEWFSSIPDYLSDLWGRFVSWAVGGLTDVKNFLVDGFKGLVSGFINGLSGAVSWLGNFIIGGITKIIDGFKRLIAGFINAIIDGINVIIRGINAVIRGVTAGLGSQFKQISRIEVDVNVKDDGSGNNMNNDNYRDLAEVMAETIQKASYKYVSVG